jgi:hypothetical protein
MATPIESGPRGRYLDELRQRTGPERLTRGLKISIVLFVGTH